MTNQYTTSAAKANAARTRIERDLGIFLGWTVPASQKPGFMHFTPMTLSDYLCKSIKSPSIGAIGQYVWTMAFAETKATFTAGFTNLIGLLPDDFGGEDFSNELPDPRFA